MSYYSNKPVALKDALKTFLDQHPQRKKLKRGMILSLLPEVAGERIMQQVKDFWLKGETLFIKVENQAWRQELHYQRFSLKERLNRRVRDEVIREIVVL
ncbi:Protein of unknown function (DUF721) [Cyclonatronum proteinivorum]|uniref:DUF721 domain-containing protein n=1 Tax=Cyclonatronum proteinivorum TaxID=1457365 RepID=A0A345UFQ0_9BACT|nr:DUF721 domain-containing protein [Cyclonatronum proteinivorum]AXI99301.1 Protein of unknown function (DUF721) [Cyclonatronum proteinivorum]